MWPGHPTDHYGSLVITTEIDQASQGNIVSRKSIAPVGVYLDDSTPDLEKWVKAAIDDPHRGLILVSVPMSQPHKRWPAPVINLLEWYPVNAGFDPGPMPKCEGYILQRHYPGYLHESEPHADLKPPTGARYQQLVVEALHYEPLYIFEF